jgi:hypothetical protein
MPALPNKNDFNRGFRRNETSLNNTNREQLLRLQQKALTQPLYNNTRVAVRDNNGPENHQPK